MKQKPNCRRQDSHCACEQHDWRKRAAVNGGAFHQRADGFQVFFGPIGFHADTLHHKVISGKHKMPFLPSPRRQDTNSNLFLLRLRAFVLICICRCRRQEKFPPASACSRNGAAWICRRWKPRKAVRARACRRLSVEGADGICTLTTAGPRRSWSRSGTR